MTSPIILNNDHLVNDPKTKFQCGSCNCLLENLNDFTNHMIDKHKINVYLMEAQNEQSGSQTKISDLVEDKAKYSQKQTIPKVSRHLKASSHQKSIVKTQNETSVRINPLYLKQFQKISVKNVEFNEQNEILNDFVNNSDFSNQSLNF